MDDFLLRRRKDAPPEQQRAPSPYVELGLTSCFSFLRGASHAGELVLAAWQQGYDAIGITDRNSFAGIVRMHVAAREAGLRTIIGCRLDFTDAPSVLVYPENRAAYGQLCRLLSEAKMKSVKGTCDLALADAAGRLQDTAIVAVPPADMESDGKEFSGDLRRLRTAFPGLSHIAASFLYRGNDKARIARLDRMARHHGLSILATNDVHYHAPARRPLQDVMTCIREKTTLTQAGYRLKANAERHLKPPDEMIRLFADWPHAITASRAIADRCRFCLDELKYEYPEEPSPDGVSPQQHLEALTFEGAKERYPSGLPEAVRATLRKELGLIEELDIAKYFITVHAIVRYARSLPKPILCQGRGSAANSAVCYCLGITAVDPATSSLLFERFISRERREPPDIDVDFEHERREEVIQHIYRRYGRDKAGIAATIIHYRPRMAIREVGKVMGLSEDVTSALAKTVWGSWGSGVSENQVREAGLDLTNRHLRQAVRLAGELIGMPRHLSQHVGGFVLTHGPLLECVPIGNGAMPDRTFIEWDKDDIDALKILKIDVLALGMLTCITKCFDLIRAHYGKSYDLANVPAEDPAVYEMLCKGDSLGTFQVESRAQMAMLPRLRPRCFYDLVIEVAIVRPGPIQGNMVHPYLRRREEREKVNYPSPSPEHGPKDELKKILMRTLGVPVFQEQAMQIAIDAAKFTPEEANQLRKAMATFRSRGTIELLQEKMVGRMIDRGYDPDFSRRCFDQIKGFGEYGFPESHAASFAHLVYISAWLKCHYPDVFACALLNSQPMGFYAPAQIVRDAREHGVEILDADVNYSNWDGTLEPFAGDTSQKRPYAFRLGLRQVDGLGEAAALRIAAHRHEPYRTIAELQERTGLLRAQLEKLAAADCLRSMGLDRRQGLWDVRALKDAPPLPLFQASLARAEGIELPARLPEMPLSEHVIADYQTLRLSLKAHPLQFLRAGYDSRRIVPASAMKTSRHGRAVRVAGLVLVRQRPGSAKGVCFITLEDETGVVNVVVWPKIMERFRKVVMTARLMHVAGTVQTNGRVTHLVADRLSDHTGDLALLSEDRLEPDIARADHVLRPLPLRHTPEGAHGHGHPRNVRIIPKSRDFH